MQKASRIARWGAVALLPIWFAGTTAAQSAGSWTQQFPSAFPSPLHAHAMAYDAAHGQVVLFGGTMLAGSSGQSAIVLPDTWTWDGSNWTHTTPGPPRTAHAMAYDSARGQVVLFGGSDGSRARSETWVWDGSNWTRKLPQNSPSARVLHAMAYDSAHGQAVLFGGVNSAFVRSNGNFLNDTWAWDSSNWTQKSAQSSPPIRGSHALAYDSAHGQVVLFGGGDISSPLGDTWAWDGSTWTQMSLPNSPSARTAHAMAYDSAHRQTVLFGGALPANLTTQTSDANDTWTLNLVGGGGGGTPAIGGVVSASAYGAFSGVAPGSWVEIYGTNLADHTRQWAVSDFNGNNAPTMLDGVQVVIGGQKAFVDYISSGQVNAQLPSNIGTGPMQITLINGNVTSAPFNITVNTTQPGLLAPPSFKIGANQYVVAQFSDGTYVLPAGSIAGVTSRPARPGETIIIYGIGFGPVNPNIPAGQIVTQSNQLTMTLQVLFGQTPAQTPYFGLAPNYVGLYQFNVVVPAVGNNDLAPLTFNLGGVPGTQTLYIAVRQ